MHTQLVCSATGKTYPVDRLWNLSEAGKPLLAEYDLDSIKSQFTPEAVRRRTVRSMWRFWDVLPVNAPEEAVSLGEGVTPLLQCERQGAFARLSQPVRQR